MKASPADDGFAPSRALDLHGEPVLRAFNDAGVLAAADVHVASALGRLGGDDDELVALAAALAVRAPRLGHVLADLATVATSVAREDDLPLPSLPWPALGPWLERLASSPLVAVGEDGPQDRPLRLVGTDLYLDRYWRDECSVALALLARSTAAPFPLDERVLAEGASRLFPDDAGSLQLRGAVAALKRPLSVIAGGPGTGKTTTVARLLALLEEQARASAAAPPLVALAAPTGKAAARMAEAVRNEACHIDVDEGIRRRLVDLDASTVHRLLGRHPASASRFRHNRDNLLPHDIVVVDETSMMSLPLMARLIEATRPEARLVLLGDHQQLASVEAGAVMGDIVGAGAPKQASEAALDDRRHGPSTGILVGESPLAGCTTVLEANYRFKGELAELARAVRDGDTDGAIRLLTRGLVAGGAASVTSPQEEPGWPGGRGTVGWLPVDAAAASDAELRTVRAAVVGYGKALLDAAGAGDQLLALGVLARSRVLCAHRNGPAGATTWNLRAEEWLGLRAPHGEGPLWYPGRPVIVTENDYGLGLFNGDVGVVLTRPGGGMSAVFARGSTIVAISPSRVPNVATAFAMTAHRAQGSEFDEVVVVLPSVTSRILTRELLYTALTRARRRVLLVGTEAAVRAAVARPVARASGLAARLWGPAGG